MIDFTKADASSDLTWQVITPVTVRREQPGPPGIAEDAIAKLAAESMRRLDEELGFAASVLVHSGFNEPEGGDAVAEDGRARVIWNLAYLDAAKAWVAGDPDWSHIGGAPRWALDLLEAGVGIQIAALAVREGIEPIAAALTLHNLSVVLGATRVHLREWLDGRPQTLAAQRARASKLKAAEWYPSVAGVVAESLDAGVKIDSIVADVLARLERVSPAQAVPPTFDAVRVKIQRVRRSRT